MSVTGQHCLLNCCLYNNIYRKAVRLKAHSAVFIYRLNNRSIRRISLRHCLIILNPVICRRFLSTGSREMHRTDFGLCRKCLTEMNGHAHRRGRLNHLSRRIIDCQIKHTDCSRTFLLFCFRLFSLSCLYRLLCIFGITLPLIKRDRLKHCIARNTGLSAPADLNRIIGAFHRHVHSSGFKDLLLNGLLRQDRPLHRLRINNGRCKECSVLRQNQRIVFRHIIGHDRPV